MENETFIQEERVHLTDYQNELIETLESAVMNEIKNQSLSEKAIKLASRIVSNSPYTALMLQGFSESLKQTA